VAEHLVQQVDGGSIPTPSLQVSECILKDVQEFVKRNHYTHSVFGVTPEFCFRITSGSEICGAAIFGKPAGMGVLKKYSENGKFRTTELRRFVLADWCPRNSESKTLGVIFRALRKKGVQRILSYADPAMGHNGTIYKATGFRSTGLTSKRKHVMWKGKKYPDRNIHQIHFPYHKELRAALESGEATRVAIPGKFIYVRDL
jgi:hypothetical protein